MVDSSFPMEIGFLIKLVYDALDRLINRELESQRLTHSQMSVLAYLYTRGETVTTIRDIQEHLNVSHPTAAGLVKRLEQKGFVHLLIDPQDKRARIVCLDSSARRIYEGDPHPTLHIEEHLLKGLTEEERRQLCELLTRIYRNIE